MNWTELLRAALFLVVAFGLDWFFKLIGFQIGDEQFMQLVELVVAWLLSLFGVDVARFFKVRGIV